MKCTAFVGLALVLALASAAIAAGQIQFLVKFFDESADEDGFRIERSVGSMTTGFVEIATIGASAGTGRIVTYIDADPALVAGTRYCYRARAFNVRGPSGYTDTICATPGPNSQ
jgi:hypothetical protein